MIRQDMRKLNTYNRLIDKLKKHSDSIEHTEAPIRNKDMLVLLELSKTTTKSAAIQFAVDFTIENFGQKAISLSPIEQKLEKMRYAEKEAHDASEELLDS